MNFLEAVKAMKEGKKVRYNQAFYYIGENGWIVRDFKDKTTELFSDTMMTNDIWQIIEEKKTLSDKMHTIEISGLKSCFDGKEINGIRVLGDWIDSTDVKEAIKEFLTFTINRVGGTINVDDFKEKAKEIFGGELLK